MEGKVVFCFEGMNSSIGKLISKLDEKQKEKLYTLCEEAKEFMGIDFLENLKHRKEDGSDLEVVFAEMVISYICDYIIFDTYIQNGIKPDILVGYSLGVNTALVCAGYLSFLGGIEILKSTIKCIEYSFNNLKEDMALIVGLPKNYLEEIIIKNGWSNFVSIASENSEVSLLITGEKEYVDYMMEASTNEGALKAIKLNTLIAFHNGKKDWMEECIKGMDDLVIFKGNRKVLSVYSLDIIKDDENLVREELKKNVYTPMKWREAIESLENQGYNQFWDVSLDGNVKKISTLTKPDSVFYSYKTFLKNC
ncbi:acyltransferase domain-containing protein [Alkaliphilus transvaalensis]|uniref:acyltransferase domain-containing protein n=1 Tax=Alkaliphilus transvaalensis TaxID=114628 RepID=UPI00047CD738|nr:acyltransferase domain-containing protein [Alkaliphilus transvaalensis]